MSAVQDRSEPADESEPDAFEIVLPITVVVLSDDDFVQDGGEERAVALPGLKQEQEAELGQSVSLKNISLKSTETPSQDGNSFSAGKENEAPSHKDNAVKCSQEKHVTERACNGSGASLSDRCDADEGECGRNHALLTSSCTTDLAEVNEASDRRECNGNDGFQKFPPLFSAGSEGRDDTIKTSGQLTWAAISKPEEERVRVASACSNGRQEEQPKIHRAMEAIVETKDPDSSENGDNEAGNRNRERSKSGDETLGSFLEHGLEVGLKLPYNCSPLLNGCSASEELLKDTGKLEMNASTSAESNTTEEPIHKTLTPVPRKRHPQQKVVSPHASPKEFQSQQEDLAWLSNSVTIKPASEASSMNKHGRWSLKCRFCSSVYKCRAHLKKHVYSAHKDKKIHKCSFCKRTFFFSADLKNHLKFHKNVTRLQNARKMRIDARKIRQRKSEERKSETKEKESRYEKFFIKMERDFTPLGEPVSFSCKICFFASSSPRIFIHHMKGHKGKPPYQCPRCDYSCLRSSYLLSHLCWHAGYKLYQCRFCTFFSLYLSGIVRHSYAHAGSKQYFCELCQLAFASTAVLKKHRKLHASTEACQGQQLDFVRERTLRPLKSYPCDECHVVFYTREHLDFHKKCHEQFKATAKIYMNQSNEYQKSKIRKPDCHSQDRVSLSGNGNACLGGGMLASEVDFEQAGDMRDDKKKCSGKKFPKNSRGSNSLPVIGNGSEVPLNSYNVDAAIFKEEPLLSCQASYSQVQVDDAYHRFGEDLRDTWPRSLSVFKMYKCEHCNFATALHSDFKLHLQIHTDKRPFVCKECGKTFETSNHLQKHSLTHVKNGYEFGRCLYVDHRLENLGSHHEMHLRLSPERDFGSLESSNSIHSFLGSEVCGLKPDAQKGKEIGLLAQSQPGFYQCTECEYTTYILGNLELHIRTHTGEKPYSCSVCQKKFRTSSHLRRHRITHFDMEHLKCRNCDYSTNKWLSLKQHLASHSCEESPSTGFLYETMQLPVKTYTCQECGYSTARSGNLKLHLRIHTGEKPFKCGQCGVAFRTSSHLKRHLLTHLKLRCRRCKFSTVDKRAFQKHVKAHKKKFRCAKCSVVLPTKKLLEKHKQQHELEI